MVRTIAYSIAYYCTAYNSRLHIELITVLSIGCLLCYSPIGPIQVGGMELAC